MGELGEAQRDHLTVAIIRAAEVLRVISEFADGRRPGRTSPQERLPGLEVLFPSEGSREIVRRYLSIFKDEINTVKLVRNSLVHVAPVADGNIETAALISSELMRILADSLKKYDQTTA